MKINREYCIELGLRGLRMPIAADLVLHELPDPDAAARDGVQLGRVLEEAARRYNTPLAFPLMDLRLEKADLLQHFEIAETEADAFHFRDAPGKHAAEEIRTSGNAGFPSRNRAHIHSVRYIAESTELVPVGMAIGPFSLLTKLMADPIPALAMAGMGVGAEEDPDVLMAERCLALAEAAVQRSIAAQIDAGAKLILICEPAASIVYISPRQMEAGSGLFDRFVIDPHLRIKEQLEAAGVGLIFHNCGELTDGMVRSFAESLRPMILSLGSSRRLWLDADLVADDIVLFGNLPTKKFYSDAVISDEEVARLTCELAERMRGTGQPFILGSECDVLHVPDAAETIRRKVRVMLTAGQ